MTLENNCVFSTFFQIHNLGDKRGGEMLTVLYYFIQHGNPVLKLMFQNILDAAARPFFVQLDLWIYEGILHDPHNEFLVSFVYFWLFFFESLEVQSFFELCFWNLF